MSMQALSTLFLDSAEILLYTTGGNFHPVPGYYMLPNGEGNFTVWTSPDKQGLHVKMNTMGSGTSYDHPMVTWMNPVEECPSGWYAWFRDICPLHTSHQKIFTHTWTE